MKQKTRKIGIILLSALLMFSIVTPFFTQDADALDSSFWIYGYVDQSSGVDVPSGTTITITDTTTSSSGETTTYDNSGDTGYYQYDLKSLSSCSDGDTIQVNCSYNGEQGSISYVLDTTDPSKNMSFQLSNLVTHTTGYFNASVNITAGETGSDAPVISNPSPADMSTVNNEYANLSVDIEDANGDDVTVTFYNALNGDTLGTYTVSGGSGTAYYNWTSISYGQGYSWNVSATDGTYTTWSSNYRFTTAYETMTTVFSPSPSDGSTNISLLPTLSVWLYDNDDDQLTIKFYDDSDVLIGIDEVTLSDDNTGKASVQWNSVTSTETEYNWYVMATTETNTSVRYPVIGYLNFTTAQTYPPVITFHLSDSSGLPLNEVNISCANLEGQTMQYTETDSQGFATMSFNYDELGKTYRFTFKKTNYSTKTNEIQIYKRAEYITLQKKAYEETTDDTGGFDIFTIFIDYGKTHLTPVGLAMLSIVIIFIGMIVASKQFQVDFVTNIFIGVALFGLFIAIGWLPWWLLLLPAIVVSLLFGQKIASIVQGGGGSGGGDSS